MSPIGACRRTFEVIIVSQNQNITKFMLIIQIIYISVKKEIELEYHFLLKTKSNF